MRKTAKPTILALLLLATVHLSSPALGARDRRWLRWTDEFVSAPPASLNELGRKLHTIRSPPMQLSPGCSGENESLFSESGRNYQSRSRISDEQVLQWDKISSLCQEFRWVSGIRLCPLVSPWVGREFWCPQEFSKAFPKSWQRLANSRKCDELNICMFNLTYVWTLKRLTKVYRKDLDPANLCWMNSTWQSKKKETRRGVLFISMYLHFLLCFAFPPQKLFANHFADFWNHNLVKVGTYKYLIALIVWVDKNHRALCVAFFACHTTLVWKKKEWEVLWRDSSRYFSSWHQQRGANEI